MLPYVNVLGKTIPVYGLAAMVGVLLAVLYLKLQEKRSKTLSADLELSLIYGLLGAVVGAKLLSIVTVLPNIIRDIPVLLEEPATFLNNYLLGGFVFYGGFYGAVMAVLLYCKLTHVSFDAVAQLLLPVFPLIHGFGRIGCFCMGCCYGKPAGDFPIAVIFAHSEIAPNGVPLLPVQLFEAALEFGLFALLVLLSRRNFSGKKMLAIYCSIYGTARFLLEFLRGDEYRGFLVGMSTSQIISIITLLLAAALFWIDNRKSAK